MDFFAPMTSFERDEMRRLRRGLEEFPLGGSMTSRRKASYADPKVGDIVRLNDTGLEICFGTTFGLGHMKTVEMTVIGVESESVTYPELTYPLDVDHPDIGMLLVDNWCFDLVRRP